MANVYFTADLHIGHKGILYHQPNRIQAMGLSGPEDIAGHDRYIIERWKSTVKRHDIVYVLGDFILGGSEYTRKVIQELKRTGCRINLVIGNHDKSALKCREQFDQKDKILNAGFSEKMYPFVKGSFSVVLCHYPLLSWEGKPRGSMNLYGHVHDNSPWIDDEPDLRLNVGIDNPFCEYGLVSLEKVYAYYLTRLGGMEPKEYVDFISDKGFVR